MNSINSNNNLFLNFNTISFCCGNGRIRFHLFPEFSLPCTSIIAGSMKERFGGKLCMLKKFQQRSNSLYGEFEDFGKYLQNLLYLMFSLKICTAKKYMGHCERNTIVFIDRFQVTLKHMTMGRDRMAQAQTTKKDFLST